MNDIPRHTHNGTDSGQIEFTDIKIFPEATITPPSGGDPLLTDAIDTQARDKINDILDLLQAKGLMK
jgi:hypothetical protein